MQSSKENIMLLVVQTLSLANGWRQPSDFSAAYLEVTAHGDSIACDFPEEPSVGDDLLPAKVPQVVTAKQRAQYEVRELLAQQGATELAIADSRIELEQCRLLTLKAAHTMDKLGNRVAMQDIAMIKVAAPRMALRVLDRAIQIHGGAGVSQDHELSQAYAAMRTLRLADGPDEVHSRTIARVELMKSKL